MVPKNLIFTLFSFLFCATLILSGCTAGFRDKSEGSDYWKEREKNKVEVERMRNAEVTVIPGKDTVKMVSDGRYVIYIRNTSKYKTLTFVIVDSKCDDEIIAKGVVKPLENGEYKIDAGEYKVYYNRNNPPKDYKERKKMKEGRDYDWLKVDPEVVQTFLDGIQCQGFLLGEGRIRDDENKK